MKVKCCFCNHHKNGFCSKKKNNKGLPIKIKANKSRSCNLYYENSVKVFEEFQRKQQRKKISISNFKPTLLKKDN